MSERCDLIVRNVRLPHGAVVDIAARQEVIVALGPRLPHSGAELDARGAVALPGFVDHHIHLLATARARSSADLSGCRDEAEVVAVLRRTAAVLPPGATLRAIGFDAPADAVPDRTQLTGWVPDRPLRVQDRTGALWLLNDAACAQLGPGPYPSGVELDEAGRSTGRILRADAWLRAQLSEGPPDLAPLSAELAALGIVAVVDAGARNGAQEAALFAGARASGALAQNVHLMGDETLQPAPDVSRGALKLHYDESDLPPLETVAARIATARAQSRAVAAHCVTPGELAWFLAALDVAGGPRRGDRIEHGSDIPEAMIGEIAARSLAVVTHPAFIAARGDRYRRDIAPERLGDLYRLASLARAGIELAWGSDAPYGPVDPWLALRSAAERRTASGYRIGEHEAQPAERTLPMLQRRFDLADPRPRRLTVGEAADIALVVGGYEELLAEPDAGRVFATVIDGRVAYLAEK